MTVCSVASIASGAGLALALTATPADAHGAQHRVAVLDPDPALVHALEVALSPWDVEVIEHPIAGRAAALSTSGAREIAAAARADVIVWLEGSGDGCDLWFYDAGSGGAVARALPACPPFRELEAAGIALSVKTALRSTVVAPAPERIAAIVPAPERPALRLEAVAGARQRTGNPSEIEPLAGVGVSVWPAAWHGRWGLAIALEGGTGMRVETDSFNASVFDLSARIAAAWRLPLGGVVALEPSLGAGAHLLIVDGQVTSTQGRGTLQRMDPAVEPRLAIDIEAPGGRFSASPWIGVAYLTRTQEIVVQGASVFDLAALVVQAGLRVSLGLE
jgi:hypothetical protein